MSKRMYGGDAPVVVALFCAAGSLCFSHFGKLNEADQPSRFR